MHNFFLGIFFPVVVIWRFIKTTLAAVWRLIKAMYAADETLSADDAASTLFRFFRSQHVADLRLIAFLATVLLLFYGAGVLTAAVKDPILNLCTNGLTKTLQHDGGVLGTIGHGFMVLLTYGVPKLTTQFTPALPVWGAIWAWAYLTAATRLGVVDLFACEIRPVCRVGTAFDIGRVYVGKYYALQSGHAPPRNGQGKTKKKAPEANNRFESEENYFPVFESNSHDLESLEAQVVAHITEFYTYMKVVRDLRRAATKSEPVHGEKEMLVNLIFVVFLGYESARNAIKQLIEFEPTKAENMMMIMLTELECYAFLCGYYCPKIDDHLRFERLTLRLADYQKDFDYIKSKLRHRDEEDPDWGPALRTLPELTERYNEMDLALKIMIAAKSKSSLQDNKKVKLPPARAVA